MVEGFVCRGSLFFGLDSRGVWWSRGCVPRVVVSGLRWLKVCVPRVVVPEWRWLWVSVAESLCAEGRCSWVEMVEGFGGRGVVCRGSLFPD